MQATEHMLRNVEHPDIKTSVDNKKSPPEGVVISHNERPIAKLVPLQIRKALANNPRFQKIEEMIKNNKKQILRESEEIKHVLSFMRANPLHRGHELVVDRVKEEAKKIGAKHTIILSHSHDYKKNPLSPDKKLKYAQNAFPQTNIILSDKEQPNILAHAHNLYKSGVKHMILVGGSDREEFHDLLKKYNNKEGKHGFYNFHSIKFIQAGEKRENKPTIGNENLTSLSASAMRDAAQKGNEKFFMDGAPSRMDSRMKKQMMKDVQKGMIKENIKNFLDFLANN
jgi:hypothetical protein